MSSSKCSSCVEDCDWQCIHEGECSLVCGAPCDRLPCNLRCDKLLACGHRCPGICGEDCPDVSLCIECCSVEIKTNIVDIFEFNTYEEQDLDSDPIIFLECGHFYSKTTMDGVMEIGEFSLKIAEIYTLQLPNCLTPPAHSLNR